MTGVTRPEPDHLLARRVLLDALGALGPHRRAVVLVGAQAIYLHVGEGDLAVAPYTTDGDLAIDPRELEDEPTLAAAMKAAGFELTVRPGTWTMKPAGGQVDLLVPAALGGAGRRGARLGVHGTEVARKAAGLEAAVVDQSRVRLAALDPADGRAFDVRVAGVCALLVAKLHKISERKDTLDRRQDKDGLDVLRILRFADTAYLAEVLGKLASHPVSRETTLRARSLIAELFADRNGAGARMAVRASAGLEDEHAIALSCEVLARRLLEIWN